MKGDLPGLSKRWPGTIGSCQYSTRLPVCGSTSPALRPFGPAGLDMEALARVDCVPRDRPMR